MSTSVEQEHRPVVSVCYLQSVKTSFNSSVPESILSSKCTDQSTFSSPSNFTIPLSELPTRSRYLSVKDRIMSRSTEHLSVVQQPRARHLFIQSAHALPRSISMADLHLNENPQSSQCSDLELIRLTPSIDGLRQSRSEQYDAVPREAYSDDLLSRLVESRGMPERNRPMFGDSTQTIERRRRVHCYSSYQDMHILSMYSDSSSVFSRLSEEMTRKNSTQSEDSSDSGSSDESSLKPKTPTDYLPFGSATNLKGSDSIEEERIRRVNARRVQVVEHNYEMTDFTDENEEIMQATMLVGPGKPKLVEIQRPPSSNASGDNICSPIHSSQVSQPSTPVRMYPEVSLFSPFDTPASTTPFSDISTVTGPSTPSPHQPRLSVRTDFSNFQARLFTPLRQPHSTSGISTTGERRRTKVADTFGTPLLQTLNRASTVSSYIENSLTKPRYTYSSDRRTTCNQSNIEQIALMEAYHHSIFRTVSATTKALDALAIGKFDLSSQEAVFFRKTKIDNAVDDILLSNLNRIFPQSSCNLLSTLAAWLIVDNHFVRMFASAPAKEVHNTVKTSYTLFPFDRDSTCSMKQSTTTVEATRMGLADPHGPRLLNRGDRTVSSPIYPSVIPSKAKSILGISSDPAGCQSQPFLSARPSHSTLDQNAERLEGKARSVHNSVQTIGRKLVKDAYSYPPSPRTETSVPARRLKSVKGAKSTKGRNATPRTDSPVDEPDQGVDRIVNALWEACCCMASIG